jgi:hypothetical protein
VGKIAQLSAIMIAVPGNLAHPTAIGFIDPLALNSRADK